MVHSCTTITLAQVEERSEHACELEIHGCSVSHSESWDEERSACEKETEGVNDISWTRKIITVSSFTNCYQCGTHLSLQRFLPLEDSTMCWSLPSVGHFCSTQPQRCPSWQLSTSPGSPKKTLNPAPKPTTVSTHRHLSSGHGWGTNCREQATWRIPQIPIQPPLRDQTLRLSYLRSPKLLLLPLLGSLLIPSGGPDS